MPWAFFCAHGVDVGNEQRKGRRGLLCPGRIEFCSLGDRELGPKIRYLMFVF
jgi:hypothetical protein